MKHGQPYSFERGRERERERYHMWGKYGWNSWENSKFIEKKMGGEEKKIKGRWRDRGSVIVS